MNVLTFVINEKEHLISEFYDWLNCAKYAVKENGFAEVLIPVLKMLVVWQSCMRKTLRLILVLPLALAAEAGAEGQNDFSSTW